MHISNTSVLLLTHLWNAVGAYRRKQFKYLLALILIASIAEMLSIGSVLPFLGALTAPERIYETPQMRPIIQLLKIETPSGLLLPLTIVFVFATVMAASVRLLLLWVTTRLSFATGADIAISIYRRTLYQPYAVHCSRNSSEVIDVISSKASTVIYSIILPALTLISSGVMLFAILFVLLIMQPLMAVLTFFGFGLLYLAIIRVSRRRLMANSITAARASTEVIKSLQEGLGGIRDILVDGSQEIYCEMYRNADLRLRAAQGNSTFLAGCPRFTMEAVGMLLIACLAYYLSLSDGGIGVALPILGLLALGAQRILPVLQNAYASWALIIASRSSLEDTLILLRQPLPQLFNEPLPLIGFSKEITLKQLGFCYANNSAYVLKDINLSIKKGSRIGFIGPTGSGKSTLLDIVMGLLEPTEGFLEVDGLRIDATNVGAWQQHIAHVPQAIFLADTTLEENIAFGIPRDKIDHARVRLAAQKAQLADTIERLPKKYSTLVGERGVLLSGGQRQRIGIARALYKNADVIIFDEATSALDSGTEDAVMQAIETLSKELTILIIAHRLTTLKNCSLIVELGEKKIKQIGSFVEIIKK